MNVSAVKAIAASRTEARQRGHEPVGPHNDVPAVEALDAPM